MAIPPGVSRRALAAVFTALPLQPAGAQYPVRRPPPRLMPSIPDTVTVPPTDVLGLISGGLFGTSLRIANDIAEVFAERAPALRVMPIVGRGSLQNLSDIMNVRDVDIGIVQSDVVASLRTQASLAGLGSLVAYLAKLYDEEIHILARKSTAAVNDLDGKRVNVDVKGSGTEVTASAIFAAMHVTPQFVNDDQEAALRALQSGQLDALVAVTGKPAPLFTAINDPGLHFLPLPLDPALLDTYLPTRLEHADYPDLVAPDGPIDTVAVGAIMAVYNWLPGTERFTRVARFVDAFFSNLAALREPPHHPKWRQVSVSAQVPGMIRFRAAEFWLQTHGASVPRPGAAR